ncbi:MAG: DUF4397 domain-containing protein [Chitinophagaceae bacterium]|nr:MAG: DUF4397 domain-containing protein [Chitinophagaceae bacterium]
MKVRNLLCSIFALGVVLAFTGCIKNTPIEPPKPSAFVSVMNISLKAPAVEMLFNTEKVTPPMSPGAYFLRYSAIDPGARNVVFKKAGSDSVVAELIPGQYYDSSEFYTILLFDKVSGGSGATRIIDNFPIVETSKTYIRFFHLSADIPNVDVAFENTKVFSGRSPADNVTNPSYNQFQSYLPGIYSIKAKLAGTDSVIASTNYSDLLAGGIYTIFLKGVAGGVGTNAYSVEVLRASN